MASIVNPRNFYVVHGWMVSELDLKANELAIYAIIYGFSQNDQAFNGSIEYLMAWTNLSKPTVINCLKSLVAKGLLVKTEHLYGAIKLCEYVASTSKKPLPDGAKNFTGTSKKPLPDGAKNFTGTSKKPLPNNIEDSIQDNIEDNMICAIGKAPIKLSNGRLIYPEEFEDFWKEYPRLVKKDKAYKAYCARIKEGWSAEQLICATRSYATTCRKNRTEEKYIMHPSTFLSQDKPFVDYITQSEENGIGSTSGMDWEHEWLEEFNAMRQSMKVE